MQTMNPPHPPPPSRASRPGLVRRWVPLALAALIVALVAVWYMSRGSLPREIRIATSPEGGLYYEVGRLLEPAISARAGRRVALLATKGSVENRERLLSGAADLAILQDGAVSL